MTKCDHCVEMEKRLQRALAETSPPIYMLPGGSAARVIAEARDFYKFIAESTDSGKLAIEFARRAEHADHMKMLTEQKLDTAVAALRRIRHGDPETGEECAASRVVAGEALHLIEEDT